MINTTQNSSPMEDSVNNETLQFPGTLIVDDLKTSEYVAFQRHQFLPIFTRRVQAVVDTINTSGTDPSIIKQFEAIHDTLLYMAPEAIAAFNNKFGAVCMANQQELMRLGIDESIRDIMNGKRD